MLGTVFLWIYWPSFNAAEATNKHRAAINTIISIVGSCTASFIFSVIIKGNLNMDAVMNSSLAGGVAIGALCDLLIHPGGPLVIGFVVGAISTYGFLVLNERF